MIRIGKGALEIALHEPLDGFYRGTRFDRSGVFDSVRFRGVELADRWFEGYDTFRHDTVCGPAEEFSAIGFDGVKTGCSFLKIGVGLLIRPDEAPYDRFRLYGICDPGKWESCAEEDKAVFRHILEGCYDYTKEIAVLSEDTVEIRHVLNGLLPETEVEVYNHNFWTMGHLAVGPQRKIDFPFRPAGHWRADYDSVALSTSGMRFSRALEKGESVYMGDTHESGAEGMPYAMALGDGPLKVEISGSLPVTHTVFWANHRVACLEPYNRFRTPCSWTVRYRFSAKD